MLRKMSPFGFAWSSLCRGGVRARFLKPQLVVAVLLATVMHVIVNIRGGGAVQCEGAHESAALVVRGPVDAKPGTVEPVCQRDCGHGMRQRRQRRIERHLVTAQVIVIVQRTSLEHREV